MRIFAFEFFSGGGLLGQPLPPSLAREGDLMLGTLVGELAGIEGVHVIASRDPRLPPDRGVRDAATPRPARTRRSSSPAGWRRPMPSGRPRRKADGPSSALLRLRPAAGRTLLGCTPEAVRLAASKLATARALAARGVPVVPTYGAGDTVPSTARPLGREAGRWGRLRGPRAARRLRRGRSAAFARRRATRGPALDRGRALEPLAPLRRRAGRDCLAAIASDSPGGRAGSISMRLPSTPSPPADPRSPPPWRRGRWLDPGPLGLCRRRFPARGRGPLVLEVNPRLTTSYCGLPAALGRNVAEMVLELRRSGELPAPAPLVGEGRGARTPARICRLTA